MSEERKKLPPFSDDHLSLVNSSVLLRSLREYKEILAFLKEEGRGESRLAAYISEQIKKMEEELRKRGIEPEEG